MFCKRCGNELLDHYVFCIKCGMAVRNVELGLASSVVPQAPLKSRIIYVILALFLGTLGIHNFYAGYSGKGIAQLIITIFGAILIFPLIAVLIWVLVDICTVQRDAKGNFLT